MNILLIGYGKIGKMIDELAQARNHNIISIIDKGDSLAHTLNYYRDKTDMAIEFTEPNSAYENITQCINNGIPVVSGTTGWEEKRKHLLSEIKNSEASLFWSSNFSIGMNMIFQLNKPIFEKLNESSPTNIHIEETHNINKKDQPSGTALTLKEEIQRYIPTKNVEILSKRDHRDNIFIHNITYDNEYETIEIKHKAKKREAFALGAIIAAEWLMGKKGFYTFEDMLQIKKYTKK